MCTHVSIYLYWCSLYMSVSYPNHKIQLFSSSSSSPFFLSSLASYVMTYHTILRNSSDYISALKNAREICDNLTKTLGSEVFPYSVFYVYYEQYLHIIKDMGLNIGVSMGMSLRSRTVTFFCALCVTLCTVLYNVAVLLPNLLSSLYLENLYAY